MSSDFKKRVFPNLKKIADHFGTPFHIYDETGIRQTGAAVINAFSKIKGFKEYFAVKALPNPAVLALMKEMGFGFDCSSAPELTLSRMVGGRGSDLMFTSNNTSDAEFKKALSEGECILNLDDITLINKTPKIPDLICFRYNPGPRRNGNSIIGNPVESKYGVAYDQLEAAYVKAKSKGASKFGLHTMLASNELDYTYMVETAGMLLEQVERISARINAAFDFINIGGGLGIPYRVEDRPLNLKAMADEITSMFDDFKSKNNWVPKLYMESGRFMTGPHGILVARAVNRKEIYRTYVGLDASMSSLMRPAMYGAYHHIDVLGKEDAPKTKFIDVVGSLCENNDKFATQRSLPHIDDGDLLCIHDTGAHGHSMGFNYNGKLRPKELMLRFDGSVDLIRREETEADYLATLAFEPDTLLL